MFHLEMKILLTDHADNMRPQTWNLVHSFNTAPLWPGANAGKLGAWERVTQAQCYVYSRCLKKKKSPN